MQPPSGEAFLTEEALHHPAARERILHVKLINPTHQFEIIITGGTRLVIETAAADPEQIGLTREAQLVVTVGHFFALPNRPALASFHRAYAAPPGPRSLFNPKKSFSSVSWPIFACNDLMSISGSFDAFGLSSKTSATPSTSWFVGKTIHRMVFCSSSLHCLIWLG